MIFHLRLPSILVLSFVFSSSAFAEVKEILALFPDPMLSVDTTKIYDRTSPEYMDFMNCQNSIDKKANCKTMGGGYLFDLRQAGSKKVDDTFDYVNRCVGMRGPKRYAKDLKPDGTPSGNGVVLSTTGVTCSGIEPDEVVSLQLVACYERETGAYCSFATACFEGTEAKGQCTKDYPAEAIYVSRTNAVASPSPVPPLVPKCSPVFCVGGLTRTATCYTDGSNSAMQLVGNSCAVEQGPDIPSKCSDPAFCNPSPAKYYCKANPPTGPKVIVPTPIVDHGMSCGSIDHCPGSSGMASVKYTLTCYQDGHSEDVMQTPAVTCTATGALAPCPACP